MNLRLHLLSTVTAAFALGCPGSPHLDASMMSDASDAHDASDVSHDVPMDSGPPPPVQVMMDFTHANGFYSAPFPSEDRRMAGDRIDMHDFPNPQNVGIISQLLGIVTTSSDGFGTTSGIMFELTGAPDTSHLPDVHSSLAMSAPVFLIAVEQGAPDYLHRYPVAVTYQDDGGPFGAPHMLVLLPQQGIPLRPHTTYAAVVLRSLNDAEGRPLEVSDGMDALVRGDTPPGMSAAALTHYHDALTALGEAGVDVSQLAGLAVFRTEDPTATMALMRDDILSRPPPTIDAPWSMHEVFDDYCVYQTTIHMPDYQGGTPPFATEGGGWVFDAMGHPVVQRMEQANLVVTVPRRTMPANGFPITVLIRTGAGGDRPLVDRGVQAVHGGPPITPGTGPAMDFARAGFAGAQVDGPLGGLRNTTMMDEQFLVFNVANPVALRDNVRESALEIILFAHIIDGLSIDASACPGVVASGPVHFDTSTMALFGHSMGSTIAPLTLAFEPRYRAAILSGAGGSWIENVVYKQSPVQVAPVIELLLRYQGINRHMREDDPALQLFQWGGEDADPPVYARYIVQEPRMGAPRNVLMVQGIVDTYILPSIANATSLSVGLDLAGTELDNTVPALSMFTPLSQLLDLSGRHAISLPVQGNEVVGTMSSTGVVVQAMQDAVEDGHEVIFQTEGPKHQYSCFLQSYLLGTPRVPAPAGEFDPCP